MPAAPQLLRFPSPPAARIPGWLAGAAFVALIAAACGLSFRHAIDFKVYYSTAVAVRNGTGPLYGPSSGYGWPEIYRYPPLFLQLFSPFARLPYALAVALWGGLKAALLWLVVAAWRRRYAAHQVGTQSSWALAPAVLLGGPYLVQEFRYGNLQLIIVALVIASLLWERVRPFVSACSLALAIALKVWPLFFVPYLLARRRWRLAAASLGLAAALTVLVPSARWGLNGTLHLLRQWGRQEAAINGTGRAIWYPSQSLHGVLVRYLSPIDYRQFPDPNYRNINIVRWPPARIEAIWLALAGLLYLALLWRAARPRNTALEHALAFCVLLLIEPNVHRIALAALLWPALLVGNAVVGSGGGRGRASLPAWLRAWLVGLAGTAAVVPLIPGAASQRLMQVLGIDFAIVALLTLALAICDFRERRAVPQAGLEQRIWPLHRAASARRRASAIRS